MSHFHTRFCYLHIVVLVFAESFKLSKSRRFICSEVDELGFCRIVSVDCVVQVANGLLVEVVKFRRVVELI